MFWKRYNDPFGVYGNMPEIPRDDIKDCEDDIHVIGCLHVVLSLIAIATGVCLVIEVLSCKSFFI